MKHLLYASFLPVFLFAAPSTAVITDGLKEGELVISEGLQRVRPGEAVSPGPASPPPTVSPAVAERGASGSGTEAKP
jgi:hypothetical protein